MGPEVDEQAESISGCFEVVVDLGPMFVGKCGDGFDLDNDLPVAVEVRLVSLHEGPTFVCQLELRLGEERNAPQFEFDLEAFLVDRLEEPRALVVVDFETRPDDGVSLVFEKDFHRSSLSSLFFPLIREIRVIRGHSLPDHHFTTNVTPLGKRGRPREGIHVTAPGPGGAARRPRALRSARRGAR